MLNDAIEDEDAGADDHGSTDDLAEIEEFAQDDVDADDNRVERTEDDDPDASPNEEEHEDDDDLPWDPERQRGDQENANLRKQVARMGKQIEALTRRQVEGPGPQEQLQKVIEELEAIDVSKIADDDEAQAAEARKRELTAKAKELTSAIAKAQPEFTIESDTPEGDKSKAEAPPTKEEFISFCEDAEAEFGSPLRVKGRIAVRKELVALGYGPNKAPTKAVLQKIVGRVYRKLSSVKPTAEEVPRQQPQAESKPNSPPGKVRLATVRGVAAQMRREARQRAARR
jgi:hypothetical protein